MTKPTALPVTFQMDFDETQPTIDVLRERFGHYADVDPARVARIPDMYGIVVVPEKAPTLVVSVDFCEVLRLTGRSIAMQAGQDGNTEYPYKEAAGITDTRQMLAILHELMKTDRVPPVEGYEEIAQILRRIRKQGGLVIGNSSTVAGCELATLDFLAKYYPGVFDGVNFNTGGHHATEAHWSKAWAVHQILGLIDPDNPKHTDMTVISVDDRPHHNGLFHEIFGSSEAIVHSVRPECRGEKLVVEEQSQVCSTPLDAFRHLNSLLP